jgi:hypothetical protein
LSKAAAFRAIGQIEFSRLSGVRYRCCARPLSRVGGRYGLNVNAMFANRACFLTSGGDHGTVTVSKRIASAHVQSGQLVIVQECDPSRRRRYDLADNRMRHPEPNEKPRNHYRSARGLCVFLSALVGNGMYSDLMSSAYVAFLCGKEDKGAYRVAFLRRVHDQALVSNDLRDLEAIFERAATGPDIQADERSALQDGFESTVISVFYVTTQCENRPEVGAHAVYLSGTDWLENRDQHEERNQLEFHLRFEEHRARQMLRAGVACRANIDAPGVLI